MSDRPAVRTTKAVILAAGKGSRMGGDLPKVLHPLAGQPMIEYSVAQARLAGASEVIVVVGYRAQMVVDALAAQEITFVVQEEQRGTGHAVACARPHLMGFDGNVVILYGDMPLLASSSIHALVAHRDATGAAGILLTVAIENPPDFGRIVRDQEGRVQRIVEVRDATAEELAIKEVNVGAYCFDAAALLSALDQLGNDNDQGEYYLTEVVEILARSGQQVETVLAPNIEETLGINDRHHLAFAEKLAHIRYAESMYELIDAARDRPPAERHPLG